MAVDSAGPEASQPSPHVILSTIRHLPGGQAQQNAMTGPQSQCPGGAELGFEQFLVSTRGLYLSPVPCVPGRVSQEAGLAGRRQAGTSEAQSLS